MKLPRPAIILSVIAAAVLIVGGLGALLLPRIVDSQIIREKVSAELAKRFGARLITGKIELLWLPRPSVIIQNVKLSFDNKNSASIRAVKVYPSLLHLLMTQFVAQRMALIEPQLTLRLPERPNGRFDLEELEGEISSAVARFVRDIPVRKIDITDGSAEIGIGNQPVIDLQEVAVQSVSSPGELSFEISGRSALWDRLRLEGKIFPEHLVSQLNIAVVGLRISQLLQFLPSQIARRMSEGEASLRVKIASVGLRQVKAAVDGSTGPITLTRQNRTAKLQIERVKSAIVYADEGFKIDIEELDLGSPHLKASGQIKIDSGAVSIDVKARNIDITEISDLALRMVDEVEGLKKIRRYLPAGILSEINVQSAGRSIADLIRSKNIVLSGLLRDGKVFIPGPELELVNVTGAVRLAGGDLEAKDITANLGTMKAWNGRLTLGFRGKRSPFHFDTAVHTRASELRSVMLKLVRDEALRAELLKIRKLEGELAGRLVLGETIDAISPIVEISKTDIRAAYAPVPLPIAITGGRLNYDRKIISLEHAQGSVGRSNFAGLGLVLRHDGSRQFRIDSKQMSVDLQQADALLRSNFNDARSGLEKVESVRGQVELRNLTLAGAYDEPARWSFATTGTLAQIEMRHADFPDAVVVSHGNFEASEKRLRFSNTSAAISDAALIGGGTLEYTTGAQSQFTVSGTATIGPQMTQRLSQHMELPREIKLRSPLEIVAEQFAWRTGDFSFRGEATLARAIALKLDIVKNSEALVVRNLTIDDGARRARMTFDVNNGTFGFSFSGELAQRTLDNIFSSFPVSGSALSGDIQVRMSRAGLAKFSALGQLSGSNLSFPFRAEKGFLKQFSIAGSGDTVLIRSADLRWGQNHFAGSGKISGANDIVLVDFDGVSDRLDWDELRRLWADHDQQRKAEDRGIMSGSVIQGTIRLKTNRFVFGGFDFSSLETRTTISPVAITTEVVHAVVCGTTARGRVDVVQEEIGVDLEFASSEAQLQPATVCLTNSENEIRGTYSLQARVMGRAPRDQLLESLKGTYEFSARNGEFIRAPGVDAAFDYLNGTGDFKIAFPDLDKETFPYRSAAAKGRIDGEKVLVDEVEVESSLLNLTGQGKVDLQRRQMEGKGLITVLGPIGQVIKKVPIIGSVLGGPLLGIPVRVAGSLERPDVTYLSPADVGAELLNIPLRILGLPLGAIRLFTPDRDLPDKDAVQ